MALNEFFLPVGIHRLPTFGRNLQTALAKLICLGDFIVSHVWLKLILRLSLSYGAYLKGLPILVETLRRLPLSYFACHYFYSLPRLLG